MSETDLRRVLVIRRRCEHGSRQRAALRRRRRGLDARGAGRIRRLGFRSPSTLILRGGTASDCRRIFGPSREHARLRATMVNARGDANRWYLSGQPLSSACPRAGLTGVPSCRAAVLLERLRFSGHHGATRALSHKGSVVTPHPPHHPGQIAAVAMLTRAERNGGLRRSA